MKFAAVILAVAGLVAAAPAPQTTEAKIQACFATCAELKMSCTREDCIDSTTPRKNIASGAERDRNAELQMSPFGSVSIGA